MVELARRGFLFGALSSIVLAPAVVKAKSMELVRGIKMTPWIDIPEWCPLGFIPYDDSKLTKQQFPDLHAWLKRCRQGGAHLSDDFKLGGEPKAAWLSGYEPYREELNTPGITTETVSVGVRIVSVAPLKRSNGSIAQPGMVIEHQIKSEIIKATQYEFDLTPEKQAIQDQWKFVEKPYGVNIRSGLQSDQS